MLFEGTEKKLELFISKDAKSLRSFDLSIWENVVKVSKAQIISSLHNDYCTAHLLSESSLFIYDNFLTMITCGNTSLVDATFEILKFVPENKILSFFYERKNPIFPNKQSTSFYDDMKKLKKHFNGEAYRFGDLTEHHICLFHKNIEGTLDLEDMTLEILMHEIDDSIKNLFCSGKDVKSSMKSLGIYDLFSSDFQIDDHIFEPYGYSLNAIGKNEYYTFHVTPGELGSYVSFETNHKFTDDYQKTIEKILKIFKPKLFDVFQFQINDSPNINDLYLPKRRVRKKLSFGYDVQFYNFYKRQNEFLEPFSISVD